VDNHTEGSAMGAVDLSVVIPVFNNASTLDELIRRLLAVLEPMQISFELVFVDDGSRDSSLALLETYAARDPRIRPLALTRNFASQAAVCAGLDQIRGQHGVIMDADFFAYLESNVAAINGRDAGVLAHVVERCCRLKAEVVEADEREETGRRSILNYGHTFCHALEAATGYEQLLHGEGVSIGMMCAARLAQRLGRVDSAFVERQLKLLTAFDLPTVVPQIDSEELIELMYHDKKTAHGELRFVLPSRLGHVELVRGARTDEIAATLMH